MQSTQQVESKMPVARSRRRWSTQGNPSSVHQDLSGLRKSVEQHSAKALKPERWLRHFGTGLARTVALAFLLRLAMILGFFSCSAATITLMRDFLHLTAWWLTLSLAGLAGSCWVGLLIWWEKRARLREPSPLSYVSIFLNIFLTSLFAVLPTFHTSSCAGFIIALEFCMVTVALRRRAVDGGISASGGAHDAP